MQAPFDIAADLDTPVSTWLKLAPLSPRYLLESVEGGAHLARYSFLGFGETVEFRLDDAGMRVAGEQCARPSDRDGLLAALRTTLAEAPRLSPAIPDLPFAGGLVGVAGYDLVRYFERLQNAPESLDNPVAPEAAYVAADSLLVFDHLTRRIALLHAGDDQARQRLRTQVIALLRGALPPAPPKGSQTPAAQSLSGDEYMRAVAASKAHIARGDVYQLVLSVQFTGRHTLSPFEAYRALRLLNPSPYMFFIDLGDIQVAGSSPEALVKLRRGHASLRPIAGTRPRGLTPEQDLGHEQSLLADEKENAEHVMLVDLARNDLGRVASARFCSTSTPTVASNATAMSCTSSVACRANWPPAGTPSTCLRRPFRPARWSARQRCGPWSSSTPWSRCGVACMRARWATSAATATWTRPLRYAP